MKTIVPIAFIAALVAFVLLPVSFAPAVSALFAAGLVAIVLSDYSRRPVLSAGFGMPAAAALSRSERLGLAA